jgi:RNA polymerase sigma factor (sigma-70 family)
MQKKLKNSLQNKTDIQLVRSVRNKASSEAFIEISDRYQDVFYKICQKYAPALTASGVFLQDIFNEKNIILLHCINTFDHKKGVKLSSWIGNYARYLCLNSINARRFIAPSTDEDLKSKIEEAQISQNYFESKNNLQEYKDYVFDLLEQLKDKRIKEIFQYRYFSDKRMIWNKIAKKVNSSPQTVMSLHKKGIILIRNKMKNSENFCDIV